MDAKKSEESYPGTDRPAILARQPHGLKPYKSHLCLL